MITDKKKRSLRNLIYRMRKIGYEIDRKEHIAIMGKKRRKNLEKKIIGYGFNVQYRMYHE